jgi:hypothetical protein
MIGLIYPRGDRALWEKRYAQTGPARALWAELRRRISDLGEDPPSGWAVEAAPPEGPSRRLTVFAFAVFVEHGGAGAAVAVPVAARFLRAL